MKIDINNDILEIFDINNNLKPRYIFQLSYWGINKSSNQEKYFGNTDNFQKIISFFEKNGIKYQLSESCKTLISQYKKDESILSEILNIGSMIKNGKIDKSDFQDHNDFLNEYIPNRVLKDHQIKSYYHLCSVKNGANFSVPGSGKTTVVLSAFEKFRKQGSVNTLFVVGPPACFGPWRDEFKLVLGRPPKFKILAGGDKNLRKQEYYFAEHRYELYLTSFQSLLNDQDDAVNMLNSKLINAYLVIDEAHYIKQVGGNRAKAVLKIAKYAKYRCILTGTPMPRSFSDLYNLFDFLWPSNELISSSEKIKIHLSEENKDFDSAHDILKEKISPLFYRVRKKDLGLDEQIFTKVSNITMNTNERKLYDAIVGSIIHFTRQDYLHNIDFVQILKKGRMMRFRQSLSYAKLLQTAVVDDYNEVLIDDSLMMIAKEYDLIEKPAKLKELLNLVYNFQQKNEKVVIWSNFIGTIKMIEKELKKLGLENKKIIGETPSEKTGIEEEETREKIRNQFVNPNSGLDILLANPAACAESISLHKTCHNAIYYDLSYNCAQYLQSLDRIHRVGGSEDQKAYYYFLQYNGTREYQILDNLEKKAEKMYRLIDGDYNIYNLDMFDDSDELSAYDYTFQDIRNES